MAIYHLSVQPISRGQGKSCVAAAAYRAGEKLNDERQGLVHDYTKKQGVESEILAPAKAPSWVYDREKLWNEVDRAETRCNSRTAREVNVALPIELSKEQQKELTREFVKDNFVNKGMVADVGFHFNDSNNPHFHVMLTTRELNENGFTNKNRNWDSKENVLLWRENWSKQANRALEKAGLEEKIDHRSYKDQGIDQVPTIHLGKTANEMEKKGKSNPRAEINKQIKELNQQKVIALQEYRELKAQLEQEKAEENKRYSNMSAKEKADLQKAESIVNGELTYEKAEIYIGKARKNLHDENVKLVEIKGDIRFTKERIKRMYDGVENLHNLNKRLSELPKGILGGYKDKYTADMLKSQIEYNKANLKHDGYTSSVSIKTQERKLAEKIEKLEPILENKIKEIEERLKALDNGIKALENQEMRTFIIENRSEFPEATHLSYRNIAAIKDIQSDLGITGIKAIEENYSQVLHELDGVNAELKAINDNESRLRQADMAFKTIDEKKFIAEKYDRVVWNKTKYQAEHFYDKMNYEQALAKLKELGINNKTEFLREQRLHREKSRNKDGLTKKQNSIAQDLRHYEKAIGAINEARRTAEYERYKEQHRQRQPQQTKSRGWEMGR